MVLLQSHGLLGRTISHIDRTGLRVEEALALRDVLRDNEWQDV
ncbi:MAG: hypothetical protein WBG95_07195 [Sulfitobacter sp.]